MNESLPDVETDDPTGVVLAGGYSRRFGDRDKALARLGGRPLLARVVGRLGDVADRVVVSCRSDQRAAFDDALAVDDGVSVTVEFVADPVPDRGPLYGFRAALGAVETETCALTACDAPFLDPRLVADLAARLESTANAPDAPDAAAVLADERLVPTQAVYRTGPARAAAEELLDAGVTRLSALLDRLDALAVPAEEVAGDAERSLFDVDTPADREAAVRMLRELAEAEASDAGRRETSVPR
ncbi:molybdenum cofactor guanylyltransferase [Halorussus gelatinilyticus]|uniref:Probable molybdenum cofactor guanylyltransferase n=1 Tax=Halorussus gelatinilyticus TaxID=2937524 RepID=A0A8U0ILD2_9EURY|nr:molybdenum cofactor guanylyltransferase [Halorussus gelatinilyticus]UPW01421.1 molybdenum cofactor guanylyltransferase [Halorussus gelatinilyticus]